MERTVKLTLLSERATSLSLMVITALLYLPGRPSTIRMPLCTRRRVTNKCRPNCRQSGFFFSRERNKRIMQDDAHHLKKNRLTSTKIGLITRKEEYFSFVTFLYIFFFLISAILRGLCTKNKKVGNAYKTYSHNCKSVRKDNRTSDKILGRTAIKAVSQNDIKLPFFNVRQSSKKEKTEKKNERRILRDCTSTIFVNFVNFVGEDCPAALITANEAVSLYAYRKIT